MIEVVDGQRKRVNESLLKSDHLYSQQMGRSGSYFALGETDCRFTQCEIILVSSGAVAEGMVRMRVDPPIYPVYKHVPQLGKNSYMV